MQAGCLGKWVAPGMLQKHCCQALHWCTFADARQRNPKGALSNVTYAACTLRLMDSRHMAKAFRSDRTEYGDPKVRTAQCLLSISTEGIS